MEENELNPHARQKRLLMRCWRLLRLVKVKAPEVVIEKEKELIQQALSICTPLDVATAMKNYREYDLHMNSNYEEDN